MEPPDFGVRKTFATERSKSTLRLADAASASEGEKRKFWSLVGTNLVAVMRIPAGETRSLRVI